MKNKILLLLAKVARVVCFSLVLFGGLIVLAVFVATIYHTRLSHGLVEVDPYYREGLMILMCIGASIAVVGGLPVIKIERSIERLRLA